MTCLITYKSPNDRFDEYLVWDQLSRKTVRINAFAKRGCLKTTKSTESTESFMTSTVAFTNSEKKIGVWPHTKHEHFNDGVKGFANEM